DLRDIKTEDMKNELDTEGVELCFGYYVMNESGGISGDVKRVVKAMYVAPKPTIVAGSDKVRPAIAGQVVPLVFNVDAGKEYGTLTVKMNGQELKDSDKTAISQLPGDASVDCDPKKGNHMECTLNWMVPDDSSLIGKTYSLKISAAHAVV